MFILPATSLRQMFFWVNCFVWIFCLFIDYRLFGWWNYSLGILVRDISVLCVLKTVRISYEFIPSWFGLISSMSDYRVFSAYYAIKHP